MLFNCVVIIAKKQTAYCNPFRPVETRHNPSRPVETRLNLSKHVSIRSDLLKPVETRFNPFRSVQTRRFQASPPPSPFSIPPSSPFSPLFFWGGGGGGGRGREREGKTPPPKTPGRGTGGDEVPPLPHRILTTKSNQNSQNLCNLLQNLCNLPTYLP